MKRGTKFILLVAALAVCVGLYFLAGSFTKKQEEKLVEPEAETIDISAGAEEDITALSWTYYDETLTLERQEDGWVCAEDTTCPIDGDKVSSLLSAVSGLSATATIEDAAELSEYGLVEPSLIVTVSTAAGETIYKLGNENAVTGAYYLLIDGSETVYTVDSTLDVAFARSLDSLVKLESPPSDIAEITGLAVEIDGAVRELVYLADSAGVSYSDQLHWFAVEEDTYTALDTDKVTSLYETITGITFTSCETWNATDAELEGYGLTRPQGRVELTYTDESGASKTFTLLFGNYYGSYIYTRIEGSKMVYLISGTVLDGFMYTDLAPTSVCLLDWDTVTGMDVTIDGVTVSILKGIATEIRTVVSDEEQTDGEEDTQPETETVEVTTWTTSDGVSLSADDVSAWLSQITALTRDASADGLEGRALELAVTFHRSSVTFPEITLEFYTYDSVDSLCIFNGETKMLVARGSIENLLQGAKSFLNAAE